MKFKPIIKKVLKYFLLTIIVGLIGFSLFFFRPWAWPGEAEGWRFFKTANPKWRAELFSNWQTVTEQAELKGSTNPYKYNRELITLDSITYEYDGQTYNASDYYKKGKLVGLMVLSGKKIVLEKYAEKIDETSKFHLWSATKSYTATVIAIAVKEGKIESLMDRVDKYAPLFKGTAYGETPIKHVLMMSSGIDFYHFKGKPNRNDMYKDIMLFQKNFDKWAAKLPRRVESGTDFNYIATDTHVLSRVLEGAYQKPFIQIVQEKLWEPGGFAYDAQWGVDVAGNPMGHCCLSITLQDFAHLGQIYLDNLVFDGDTVVEDNWFDMVENAQASFQEPQFTKDGRFIDGYSVQWWLPYNYDQEFIARGAFGQYLYVNKRENYVVAQFSIGGGVTTKEEVTFYRAIGKYLKNK